MVETIAGDHWDHAFAASLSGQALVRYRYSLLASDLKITDRLSSHCGLKHRAESPLSGGDMPVQTVAMMHEQLIAAKTPKVESFEQALLDQLLHRSRWPGPPIDALYALSEALGHCCLDSRAPLLEPSVLVHAACPHMHSDWLHPDALMAIALSTHGQALTAEIYAGALAWFDVPEQAAGQSPAWLSIVRELKEFLASRRPTLGVVVAGLGVLSLADDPAECYRNSVSIARQAERWFAPKLDDLTVMGEARLTSPNGQATSTVLLDMAPKIRGLLSHPARRVAHLDTSPPAMAAVQSKQLQRIAGRGSLYPSHAAIINHKPLVIPASNRNSSQHERLSQTLVEQFAADRTKLLLRAKVDGGSALSSAPIEDPKPKLILVPDAGLMAFGESKAKAWLYAQCWRKSFTTLRRLMVLDADHALAVPPGQTAASHRPVGQSPVPRDLPLAGRVAVVSGSAGGIGLAVARRLATAGSAIMLTDIDHAELAKATGQLQSEFGRQAIHAVSADVAREADVKAVFDQTVQSFGGVDIIVANAGFASAAPLDETSAETWDQLFAVLAKGAFLCCREGFKLLKKQGLGGAIVTIGSKNGVMASSGAAAYGSAKAALLHLTRSLALEGAPFGIRANAVNPDAVFAGSRLWQGPWLEQRLRDHGVEFAELEDVYRNRSLLNRSVYAEDVAEAVVFLASDKAAKSTGNMINVDAGMAAAFTR